MNSFRRSIQFLATLKNTFLFTGGIVLASTVTGIVIPEPTKDLILHQLTTYLGNVHFSLPGIFMNNIITALVLIVGGFIVALPTLLSGALNFMILGTAGARLTSDYGLITFLISVMPHGIFELIAAYVSMTLGVTIAANMTGFSLLGGQKKFGETLKECALVFLQIIVPLFFIAAVIEVYVTPYLIHILGLNAQL